MAKGLQFLIELQTRMPGMAQANSGLAAMQRQMNATASSIRTLEAAQKRLNAAGKVNTAQFAQITQAKGALQGRLAGLTNQFVNLSRAEAAAGDAGTTGMAGLSDALSGISPQLGGLMARFAMLGAGGAAAVASIVAVVVVLIAVVAKAVVELAKLAIQLTKMAITAGVWAEKQQHALGLLLKSEMAGRRAFNRISELAADLGLDVQATVEQFKKLLAMQFSVAQAEGIVKMAADMKALGATAQEVDSIIRAIGQIKGKGRLQMEELQQQLAETGIAVSLVIDELAKSLGKSADEIRKMISAGKIGADVAIEAIQNAVKLKLGIKEMGDAAKSSGQLIGGLWDRLKARLQKIVTDMGTAILPILREKLIPAAEKFFEFLKSPDGQGAIAKITGVVKMLAHAFGVLVQMAGAFIQGVMRGMSMSADLGGSLDQLDPAQIERIVEAAARFGEAVGTAISKVLELIDALSKLGSLGGGGPGGIWQNPMGTGMNPLTAQGHSAGMSLAQGMAAGISAGTPMATAAASSMANAVAAAARQALQIGSPSKLFEQYGMWTGEGLERGQERAAPGVEASARSMLEGATSASTKAIGGKGGVTLNFNGPMHFHGGDGKKEADDFFGRLTELMSGAGASVGAEELEPV